MKIFKHLLLIVFFSFHLYPLHAQQEMIDDDLLTHPYLFFSKDDLPEIRERLTQEPFKSRWSVFMRNADAIVATEAHRYDADRREAGRARKHLENAGKTAFAYVITGEKKYAERAVEEAMSIGDGIMPAGKEGFVWYNPSSRRWNKGADLNTAEVCYGLAMVYDWCYDALTGEERAIIREALLEKGIRHFLHSVERDRPDFWVGNPVSNWAGVVNGGVGLGALAIYSESEKARKVTRYAYKYVNEFLDHVFLEDGGGHEGVMYARYGELFSLYFMLAHQRLFGLEEEMLRTLVRKMVGYWDIYLQAPDMKYANFNNMGEHTFQGLWGLDHRHYGGPNSDINALVEALIPGGDPLLLWAADNGAPRFYWNGASPWYFLWRRADAGPVPAEEKPALQDAVLFRGAGHAVFHSNSLWLAYNGGWISDRSHNNRDLGSFVLVVDEERMVHDPGYGDGHALNHSTVAVNQEDQIQGKGGKYLGFGSGNSFHYLATDLTNAYNPEHVQKFIRHLLMVKDDCIVLVDEIGVKDGAEVEWRLQTRLPAEVYKDQHAVIHGENHRLMVLDAADQTQTAVIAWEGKNGKLNTISKKPVNTADENLIVTVLIPSDKRVELDGYPTASYEDGTVTVQVSPDESHTVEFVKAPDKLELIRVNDEHNFSMSDMKKRSIKPYGNHGKNLVDWENLPSWFFPTSK